MYVYTIFTKNYQVSNIFWKSFWINFWKFLFYQTFVRRRYFSWFWTKKTFHKNVLRGIWNLILTEKVMKNRKLCLVFLRIVFLHLQTFTKRVRFVSDSGIFFTLIRKSSHNLVLSVLNCEETFWIQILHM